MSIASVREEYDIVCLQTVEAVESMRPAWESMQQCLNADIDYYILLLKSRPEILAPCVLVLSVNDCPKSMLIGRVEEKRLNLGRILSRIYSPRIRVLRILHGGWLGDHSETRAEAFVSELQHFLRSGYADMALFEYLDTGSFLYQHSTRRAGRLRRGCVGKPELHWALNLPPTMEELFGRLSSNSRKVLRRLRKRLQDDYPGKVRVRRYESSDQVAQLCNEAEEIARGTRKRAMNVGFADKPETRARLALHAAKGRLRAYVLHIENRPCAFYIGILYNKIYYLIFTGYDPNYSRFEVGTFLLAEIIKEFCGSSDATRIDFGPVDFFHKRRFCDHSVQEANVCIFPDTLLGFFHKLARSIFGH